MLVPGIDIPSPQVTITLRFLPNCSDSKKVFRKRDLIESILKHRQV